MEIKVNGKWYEVSWFDDFEEIEMIGEIEETKDIPDCIDLERDWDAIREYLGLTDYAQQIVMAYAEATNVFNPEEALEAYIGRYATPADFCEEFCSEVEYEALDSLPGYLLECIDWEMVWVRSLHHDYFEYSGYYFRNV